MKETLLNPKALSENVQEIADKLNKKIIGQERAIKQIIKSYLPMTVNLHREGRPLGVFLFMGPTGVGKCLDPCTPVLMFDGSIKQAADVQTDDLLMGSDSKPRRVLSTIAGEDYMYDVIPVKGDRYRVNSAHILSLQMTNHGTRIRDGLKKSKKDGAIINIPVLDYLKKSKTWQHCAKGYRTGVEFEYQFIPVEPYFLGLWLGDGNSDGPAVTTADHEIVDYLYDFAERVNVNLRIQNGSGCQTYHLTVGNISGPRKGKNPLRTALQNLTVLNNKHIPLLYKANSVLVRKALLAGLIDSDGSKISGGYEISSISPILAEDIAYIARSLGLAAYIHPTFKTCQTGAMGVYYRVGISGDVSDIPVKIARKKQKIRKQKKNVLRTGITVKPAGYGRYVGFTLDRDGLFLLGDFTVTHNTETVKAFSTTLLGDSTAFTRVDCVEFGESHEVAKLLGAPPGYVGYKDTPRLSQKEIDKHQTKENKVNIVLFDEIEKADDRLFDAIMTILGDGRITLGSGDTVDFSQSFIFLTSNLGSQAVQTMIDGRGIGFSPSAAERADMDERIYKMSKEAVKKQFRPEFINRLDSIVVFHSLSRESLTKILKLELDDLQWRIWKSPWRGFTFESGQKLPPSRSIVFRLTDEAMDFVLDEGTSELYGARELNRAIDRFVAFPLAALIASGQINCGDRVKVGYNKGDKDLTFSKVGVL